MSEKEMPVAEANSYELAFHILPTVAEGEVVTVFNKIKELIAEHGGAVSGEEAPARFDLAYDVVKHLEGRNRKFSSAYFGWVRFTADAESVLKITAGVEAMKEMLRHLLTRLSRVEEENPFYFHEALAKVRTHSVNNDTEESDGSEDGVEPEEVVEETEDGEEEKENV